MQHKLCTKCKVEKPLESFGKRKGVKDGRRSQCTMCDIEYNKKYYHAMPIEKKNKKNRKLTLTRRGLTQETYDTLYKEHKGCCAICGKEEKNVLRGRLNIDHCHTTGKVRGLLCHNCNAALGLLEDSIDNLTSAVSYLLRNK